MKFGSKNLDRVVRFVEYWPKQFPLTIKFRHTDWCTDEKITQELYQSLKENNIANVLIDTADRRDLMHMRLTNNEAFIRYVGANHVSDYSRIDDWVVKLYDWKQERLKKSIFLFTRTWNWNPLYYLPNLSQN